MMLLQRTPLIFVFASFLFFISCNDDSEVTMIDDPSKVPFVLVDETKVFTKSVGEIKSFIQLSGLDIDVEKILYNVSMYRVTYKTVYKGDSINASGIVLVPETEDTISTISFQHGTVAANAQVPSQLALNDGQIILFSAMASAGFLTVAPDFVGFGESSDIVHPYYHEYYTATAIVNNIYAAKQIAEKVELNIDTDLYLTGYSQGGHATMATHKYFEENGMNYFDLKASFPSSGGYDVKGVQDFFFMQETYDQPFFLAFVAMSYKTAYDWAEPLTMLFNEPYAGRIPALFDGFFTGDQINEQLTTDISDLVNADYLNSSSGDAEFSFMYDALDDNSLLDWTPQIRMYMYHGDADITVPYQNSVDTYNHLIDNGASTDVVTFLPLEGGTHGSGVGPWIEEFISELIILENK